MRIRLAKEFTFDAAHWLPGVPEGHKCRRMHGHTYRVEVQCEGPVDAHTGMIIDYAELARAWSAIHEMLDHRTLNEVPGLGNPTTEILVPWIYGALCDRLPGHLAIGVRVYESSTTWCETVWYG